MSGPAPRTGGTMTGGPANDATRLKARLAALEADHRRAFDQAQHEADALFAQYQLSPADRVGRQPRRSWAAPSSTSSSDLPARTPERSGWGARATRASTCSRPPGPWTTHRRRSSRMSPTAAGTSRSGRTCGSSSSARSHRRRCSSCGSARSGGRSMPTACASPSLPATSWLWRSGRHSCERRSSASGTSSSAVVDGATDVIVQVDEARRVVRLNPAGERTLGHQHRGGRRTDLRRRPRLRRGGWPRRRRLPARRGHLVGCVDRLSRDRDPVGRRESRSASRAATRERRRRPAVRSGRRRSSATSAPSGRSRSCAKASSRQSATSCGRRSRLFAATRRPCSTSTWSRPSSASTSTGSTA